MRATAATFLPTGARDARAQGRLVVLLVRDGATVVGIDASAGNIGAARRHAAADPAVAARLDYRHGDPAAALQAGERFDLVLALEVVEHVDDVPAFLAQVAAAVAPGGLLVASTINRTARSWLLAIVAAEYLLRVLPIGTHRWRQFVTPDELDTAAQRDPCPVDDDAVRSTIASCSRAQVPFAVWSTAP